MSCRWAARRLELCDNKIADLNDRYRTAMEAVIESPRCQHMLEIYQSARKSLMMATATRQALRLALFGEPCQPQLWSVQSDMCNILHASMTCNGMDVSCTEAHQHVASEINMHLCGPAWFPRPSELGRCICLLQAQSFHVVQVTLEPLLCGTAAAALTT